MAEIGVVVEEKGKNVIVALERKEACATCKACSMGLESKDMILEAKNSCGAKKGDYVTISLEERQFMQAVAIMYVVPLLGLLVGTGIGYLLWQDELIAIIMGFALLALSFLGIRFNEKRIKGKSYRPVAENVVKRD